MPEDHIYKYHGTGNDFVVMRDTHPLASAEWAPLLCDRHRGIGADGLLILGAPEADGDVRLTIINADGSRPQMCGNGVRCVARYLVEVEGAECNLTIESDAGPRPIEVVTKGPGRWEVAVDMGKPEVSEQDTVPVGDESLMLRHVSMGNPHAVCFVEDFASLDAIDRWGRAVNDAHPAFPEGVNLEFAVRNGDQFDVIVFERGVGRTQACGTGACAVAAAAWRAGHTDKDSVVVGLPGGNLTIERRGEHVWMTGGVEAVFRATVDVAWVHQRKEAADTEVPPRG